MSEQLEMADNNQQQTDLNYEIRLKIVWVKLDLKSVILSVTKNTTLKEVMEHLIKVNHISKSINDFKYYSQQKQQFLNLDDTFAYTHQDILSIQEKKKIHFIIQLKIGDVKENIAVSLLKNKTIKDIKRLIQEYLKEKQIPEFENIEIYKDSILQNDENISVSRLLKFHQQSQQPNIEARCIIGLQQNDFNIQSEIQLLKELIDTKLKNLELLFMKMLNDSRNNILKELEFFERDITQIQQLLKKQFDQQQQSQLIKYKVISFNEQKEINKEHIQKLYKEFEQFQLNLQKEQQELYKKQRNCFDKVKIDIEKTFKLNQVDEQKVLGQYSVEVDDLTTFEELLEYLEQVFSDKFEKYTQALGPLNQWEGLSENQGKVVKLQEILNNHRNDKIKFGPIHIDLSNTYQYVQIKLYGLKYELQV